MSDEQVDPRAIVTGLCASITPGSQAQALGAERRLARRPGAELGLLERLAIWLAAARHAPTPEVGKKRAIVAAADHGVGHPGIDLGDAAPTAAWFHHIAEGGAALSTAARRAGVEVALVDAGTWVQASQVSGLIDLRMGPGTRDITAGTAMSPRDAAHAIAAGVALVLSLGEEGLDVVALGAIGVGGEVASTAVIAALTGASPEAIGGPDAPDAARALAANAPDDDQPIEVLAAVGGFEIAVLAGAILGAAAIAVPAILDDHATGAAALVAARLAPHARDYLLAAHTGSIPAHRAALDALSLPLDPLLSAGVSRGDGTGAVLALPALDAAASLLRDRP